MSVIKQIIIHCSASPYGNAAMIAKWHLQRGWSNIGYHLVILNGHLSASIYNARWDGLIETGRPLDNDGNIEGDEIGAHTLGLNSTSIGICLIGSPTHRTPFTSMQMDALAFELYLLRERIKDVKIKGHYQVDSKKPYCPGFDVPEFLKERKIAIK
jgi:N-acetylmuramoyl-L-alanine amidase